MRDYISKKDFAELYILNALSSVIERPNSAHSKLLAYRDKLTLNIADLYLNNLRDICIDEALYIERIWPKDKKKRDRLCRLGITNTQMITDTLFNNHNKVLTADRLIAVFECMSWNANYGGTSWTKIAQLYKELLLARQNYNDANNNFNPDNGYDTYTHTALNRIREHLEGRNTKPLNQMMSVIDKIHHLEHNTGMLMDKFAFSATSWINKLMNEKAIPASVQVLADHVGPEIKNAIKDLALTKVDAVEIERQLGSVILSNEKTLRQFLTKEEIREELRYLEEEYEDNKVDEIKYQALKRDLSRDLVGFDDDMYLYVKALSDYIDQPRERRGILRHMIDLSKDDKRFIDPNNGLLDALQKDIMKDYEMFNLLIDTPEWHNELIRVLTPYYFKLPLKWHRTFANLVHSNFPKILEERELSEAMIVDLYDNLQLDGYDMTNFERPETDVKPKPVPQVDIEKFVERNLGKEIIGTPKWFDEYINTQASYYAVSKYMPIGKIVGWKLPNKVCFAPSDHWILNNYLGEKIDFEYCGSGEKPLVYEIALEHTEIYDKNNLAQYGKPRNYKDFAYIYAGHSLTPNTLLNFSKWKLNSPFGTIIGYAANQDKKGYIYYIPTDEFISAGYEPKKPTPGEIIYTLDGMNDDNVVACGCVKYDDVSVYTDPEHKIVDFKTTPATAPPKGSVDAEYFSVKYAGKKIKATPKFAKYLNAVRAWDENTPIGTIVGVNISKRLCFEPSPEFIKAGWAGVVNFDKITYVLKDTKCAYYYSIDYGLVELLTPEDYEDQYCGELITDDDLTPNQRFALENAGREFAGRGQPWVRLFGYDVPIGRIVGYKGSLICYVPSKRLIEMGFEGELINDIIYTDPDYAGEKCYTLISSYAVRFMPHSSFGELEDVGFKSYGRQIKAKGGIWADMVNDQKEKWNLNWPLGTIVGYHKVHNCLAFIPSKKLMQFGFDEGNQCYIGVENTGNARGAYYQLPDLVNIEVVIPAEKPKKLTDGARFAQENVGKQVKRSVYTQGWDKSKPVGTIVGYKGSNGSIIWVPTDEYVKFEAPGPLTDDAIILQEGFDKNTLVHSCWQTSLDVIKPDTNRRGSWVKNDDGGYQHQAMQHYGRDYYDHYYTGEHSVTAITPAANNKKKKKVKDRPWDKPLNIEPIDMKPYVETNEQN